MLDNIHQFQFAFFDSMSPYPSVFFRDKDPLYEIWRQVALLLNRRRRLLKTLNEIFLRHLKVDELRNVFKLERVTAQ